MFLNNDIIQEAQFLMEKNAGKICRSKSYCSPRISSELMDCSMPMTFDQYSFCSMGCMYCFAYYFKTSNPSLTNLQLTAVNSKKLIQSIEGHPTTKRDTIMYNHFYKRKFLLHWGGLADPFCTFERQNKVGYDIIKGLGDNNYPCLFSFKGATIFKPAYEKIFQQYAKQKNFAFQVSIVTNSDKMSKIIEIGVPPTSQRLEAIKQLSDMGYWTILRLRPFIIGITDVGLEELLYRALDAGINAISVEFFALDARCNAGMKKRYNWLAQQIGVDNLQKYFSKLSPSCRGGYMRLNRLVKEPFIKLIYSFCVKNNIVCGVSDPDFKELNTSGSCCGMPDNYPKNKLLENWTHSQLTYHLKTARKNYHKTHEPQLLHFSEVYKNESYLDDTYLANEHIGTLALCTTDTKNSTLRTLIQERWNNLGSPSCPVNYFHGKVLPIDVDSNGDLVFQYTEHEYECAWKEEGIDLTK